MTGIFCTSFLYACVTCRGPGSSVGIATELRGWTVRESNPGWGARFSAPVQTGPGAHPASCTMGTGSFPGDKERPGRDSDPTCRGPVSVVGIATGYGLDGTGIESRLGGGEIFRTCPVQPWGPPSLLCYGYRVFPRG